MLLTPPQLSQRWQVKISKIYGWINSGELVAANMSSGNSRPRWRITEADAVDFMRKRMTAARTEATRRKRIEKPVKEYV